MTCILHNISHTCQRHNNIWHINTDHASIVRKRCRMIKALATIQYPTLSSSTRTGNYKKYFSTLRDKTRVRTEPVVNKCIHTIYNLRTSTVNGSTGICRINRSRNRMFSSSQGASEHHQSDFQILSGIVGGLRQHKPHVKSCKKAAVALILRMEGDDLDGLSKTHQFSNSSDAEIVEQFLGTSLAQHGRLELLYMKRTANPGDTWSGHVSFPGGRQQESDTDDRDTAIREVYEEVGVSLAPTQHPTRPENDADARFVCVGRLDDRQVFGGGAAVTGFAMCAFVFLQVDKKPVRFTMQQKEVTAVLWAPVRMLHPASVHFSDVVLPYRILALQNWLPEVINRRLGLDTLCFPSIALHELNNVVVCHQRQLDPGTPGEEFVLWGMTLRATSALVHFVDVPRLDWPPATVNNRVLNWVVQIVASCMRYTNPDVVRRWHG